MGGYRECPECGCTDVPANARICPFCGHPLEALSHGTEREEPELGGIPEHISEKTGFILIDDDGRKRRGSADWEQRETDRGNPAAAPGNGRRGAPGQQDGKRAGKPQLEPVEPWELWEEDEDEDFDGLGDLGVGNPGAAAVRAGRRVCSEQRPEHPGKRTPVPGYGAEAAHDMESEKMGHGFHRFLAAIMAIFVIAFMLYWLIISFSGGGEGTGGSAHDASSAEVSHESTEDPAGAGEEDSLEGMEAESAGDSESGENSQETESESERGEYILPLSDQVYLTREDIEGLTAEELRIARNEIYARHGRLFRDEGLQAYFNSCSWYAGRIPADDFSDDVFNEYERANKDLIVSYEHELGVNGQ